MAENYKHLYEQTKKMLAMYQDELVPGFRKHIEELEKNQVKVRCKDCKHWQPIHEHIPHMECQIFCGAYEHGYPTNADDFCSYGEKQEV